MSEQEFERLVHAARFLDLALARMPARAVSAEDARSEFIEGLDLPDGTDEALFHSLLRTRPEHRPVLAAHIERMASGSYEDILAELRASLAPIAERQALRSMICKLRITRCRTASGQPEVQRASCSERYVSTIRCGDPITSSAPAEFLPQQLDRATNTRSSSG